MVAGEVMAMSPTSILTESSQGFVEDTSILRRILSLSLEILREQLTGAETADNRPATSDAVTAAELATLAPQLSTQALRLSGLAIVAHCQCSQKTFTDAFVRWISMPSHNTATAALICSILDALSLTRQYTLLSDISIASVTKLMSTISFCPGSTSSTALFTVLRRLLLGFQHSPQLLLEAQSYLLKSLANIDEETGKSEADAKHSLAELIHSLLYLHRGHRQKLEPLALKARKIPRPSVSHIETVLQRSAWHRDSGPYSGRLVPWFEGIWQAKEGTQLHQQVLAESIDISATSHFVGRTVSASLKPLSTTSFHIKGVAYVPFRVDSSSLPSRWVIDAHWMAVGQNSSQTAAVASAPPQTVAKDWQCSVCTVNNSGAAAVCSVCSSPAPPVTYAASENAENSVLAPCRLLYDVQESILRGIWFRGESSGSWLAVSKSAVSNFELAPSAVPSLFEAQTNVPVYTPRGVAGDCLQLDKSFNEIFTLTTSFTIEFWICSKTAGASSVMGNASWRICIDVDNRVNVNFGTFQVIAQTPLTSGEFVHISVVFDGSSSLLQLRMNGITEGEVVCQGTIEHSRFPVLIGGHPEPLDKAVSSYDFCPNACFSGSICELAFWTVIAEQTSANRSTTKSALQGREEGLVGYWPLIGRSRFLSDLGPSGLHARVHSDLEGLVSVEMLTTNLDPLETSNAYPIKGHFGRLSPSFLFAGGVSPATSTVLGGDAGLRVEAANRWSVWKSKRVNLEEGFEIGVELSKSRDSESSGEVEPEFVIALADSAFWDLRPLYGVVPPASAGVAKKNLSAEDALSPRHRCVVLYARFSQQAETQSASLHAITSQGLRVTLGQGYFQLTSLEQVEWRYDDNVFRTSLYLNGRLALELPLDLSMLFGSSLGNLWTALASPRVFGDATSAMEADYSGHWLLRSWRFQTRQSSVSAEEDSSFGLMQLYTGTAGALGTSRTRAKSRANLQFCMNIEQAGKKEPSMDYYTCRTCSNQQSAAICSVCAKVCHKAHELFALGTAQVTCICSSRSGGVCSGLGGVDPEVLKEPVKASGWVCGVCTVNNDMGSMQCSVCSSPAPATVSPAASSAGSSSVPSSSTTAMIPFKPADGMWTCATCTMRNAGDVTVCAVCTTARQGSAEDWICSSCETRNSGAIQSCVGCSQPRPAVSAAASTTPNAPAFVALEWACPVCTVINAGGNQKCSVCETPKPQAQQPANPPPASVSFSPVVEQQPISILSGSTASSGQKVEGQSVLEEKPTAAGSLTESAAAADPTLDRGAQLLSFYEQSRRDLFGEQMTDGGIAGLAGDWDCTDGTLSFDVGDAAFGEIFTGCGLDGSGTLRGTATIEKGQWKLDGSFKPQNRSYWGAFAVTLDSSAAGFKGAWYRGDTTGDWEAKHIGDSSNYRGSQKGQPMKTGLVNMKDNLTNICYQNSFLQSLFMTDAFREAMLWSKVVPAEQAHQKEDLEFLNTTKVLFNELSLTQRPHVASYSLQKYMPEHFQPGRQQDASDFANFVVDRLTSAFQATTCPDAFQRCFGGSQATALQCKNCGKVSTKAEYFWELMLNMLDLRYTAITGFAVVAGDSMNSEIPEGFERLNNNLNQDKDNAPHVFLCIRRNPSEIPVTEIAFKAAKAGEPIPALMGYECIQTNLNPGGTRVGDQVYMYYRRSRTDSPITDIQIMYGDQPTPDSYKQINFDLNQGVGTKTFVCYRSDLPIRDITVVRQGVPGYKMVHGNLNLTPGSQELYLAYTDGGEKAPITGLEAVAPDQIESFANRGFQPIGPTTDNGKQFMVLRGEGCPLYTIDVFRAPRTVPRYQEYEQFEVRSGPEHKGIIGDWKGRIDGRPTGKLVGMAISMKPLHWDFIGTWTDTSLKCPQGARLVLSAANNPPTIFGQVTDPGTGLAVAFHGQQTSKTVVSKDRITEIAIVKQSDQVPPNFEVLRTSVTGLSGDLNYGTGSSVSLYICFRRGGDKPPISDIAVIYGEIDPVPEGYTAVYLTVDGASANLNSGTSGSPMFICYRHVNWNKDKQVDPDKVECLSDIGVVRVKKESVPTGFVKLGQTPLGMEANLNAGTSGQELLLCFRRSLPAAKHQSHPLNGEYASTWGQLHLKAVEKDMGCFVEGVYDSVAQGYQPGRLMGIVLGVEKGENPTARVPLFMGFWADHLSAGDMRFPCEFKFDKEYRSATGWWANAQDRGEWNLMRDTYVHVGFKRDYGTMYVKGKESFTERLSSHHIKALIARFASPRILGGDNKLQCDSCKTTADVESRTVIVEPPMHLLVTIKRMWYDWKRNKPMKSLHDVEFDPTLELPKVPEHLHDLLYDSKEKKLAAKERLYGLYAVVVHSGSSANSGHYYTFARNSGGEGLTQQDSPAAPWIKFNDTKVTITSWDEMKKSLKNSVSDSAYLLFYKRLSDDYSFPVSSSKALDGTKRKAHEEDEDMMLAKAMALSMSTAHLPSAEASPSKAELPPEAKTEGVEESKDTEANTTAGSPMPISPPTSEQIVGEAESKTEKETPKPEVISMDLLGLSSLVPLASVSDAGEDQSQDQVIQKNTQYVVRSSASWDSVYRQALKSLVDLENPQISLTSLE